MNDKNRKVFKLLNMCEHLCKDEAIVKGSALILLGISSKTFQRGIESIRLYYMQQNFGELVYDRKDNCYWLRDQTGGNITKKGNICHLQGIARKLRV